MTDVGGIGIGSTRALLPENKNGVLKVICRAIGGRALLTPGPNPFKFNELVAGIIGRALEISPRLILRPPLGTSSVRRRWTMPLGVKRNSSDVDRRRDKYLKRAAARACAAR